MGNNNCTNRSQNNTLHQHSSKNLLQGSWWLTADYKHWEVDVESRHVVMHDSDSHVYHVKVLKYYDDEIRYAYYQLHYDSEGNIVAMTMDKVRHPVRIRWTDGINMLILEGTLSCGTEFMSVLTRDQRPSAHCWQVLESILGKCDSWRQMEKAPGAFVSKTAFQSGMGCTFNGELYSGKWWEAGRYPMIWEERCARAQADYTVNRKTGEIFVTNNCFNEFNDLKESRSGLATPVDEGHFSLRFNDGGPVSAMESPYVVAWTDYENYAIVGCMEKTEHGQLICHGPKWDKMQYGAEMAGSSSDCEMPPHQSKFKYGWLLSRKCHVPEIEKAWLGAKLRDFGYDPTKMIWAKALFS